MCSTIQIILIIDESLLSTFCNATAFRSNRVFSFRKLAISFKTSIFTIALDKRT